jgi:hypothetical protein
MVWHRSGGKGESDIQEEAMTFPAWQLHSQVTCPTQLCPHEEAFQPSILSKALHSILHCDNVKSAFEVGFKGGKIRVEGIHCHQNQYS